jgi:NPCBM/NEW2 domain-containing protein
MLLRLASCRADVAPTMTLSDRGNSASRGLQVHDPRHNLGMADIDPQASTNQPTEPPHTFGTFLTLSVFVALGVVADIFDITNTWLDGVEVVAFATGIGLAFTGSYLVWRQTRQNGVSMPRLGLLISAAGLMLACGVAAYDAGESEGSSRRSGLEAANAELRRQNDELSHELGEADGEIGSGSEQPSSDTTSEASTSTSAPSSGDAVYLADLDPVGTQDDGLEPGTWEVEGIRYENSLGMDTGCLDFETATVEYNVSRHYRRFHASIGLSDEADAEQVATFDLLLDGTVRFTREVGLGETVVVEEDISGAYRLQLVVTSTHNDCGNEGSFGVWGDASVTV